MCLQQCGNSERPTRAWRTCMEAFITPGWPCTSTYPLQKAFCSNLSGCPGDIPKRSAVETSFHHRKKYIFILKCRLTWAEFSNQGASALGPDSVLVVYNLYCHGGKPNSEFSCQKESWAMGHNTKVVKRGWKCDYISNLQVYGPWSSFAPECRIIHTESC